MSRHIINPQIVSTFFNQRVKTPLGSGQAFGLFHLKDRNQESIGQRVVVRLPVNDVTRPHLKAEHCLTQNASLTAIFTFALDEVSAP